MSALKFAFWALLIWGVISVAATMGYAYIGMGGNP